MSQILHRLHKFDRLASGEEAPKQTGTRILTLKPWEHNRPRVVTQSPVMKFYSGQQGQRVNILGFGATNGLCCVFFTHTGRAGGPRTEYLDRLGSTYTLYVADQEQGEGLSFFSTTSRRDSCNL